MNISNKSDLGRVCQMSDPGDFFLGGQKSRGRLLLLLDSAVLAD